MTVQELINGALRLIGVIASGESPATEESNDALVAVNDILDSWSAQQLPLYAITKTTVSLTGAASYTLGSHLLRIKSADVITSASVSRPVEVVDSAKWGSILDKSRTGLFAEALFYDAALSSPKVYLSPMPGSGTLEIWSLTELTSFSALSDTVTFPKGYNRALRFALAMELAPEYGRALDPNLAAVAAEAKGTLMKLNAEVLGEAIPAPPPQQQVAA